MTDERSDVTVLPTVEFQGELLDREASLDYIREWTAHIAEPKVLRQSGNHSMVIFRVNTEWLALSTKLFQEVVDLCTIRTLPHHRAAIEGLVSIRGELLICISLGALLGVGEVENARKTRAGRVLILNRDGGRFAIQVAEVAGIHRFHETELRPVPATLAKTGAASFTKGIFRWQGKAIACLDEGLLLYELNKRLS